jgi:tRNA/tmRNA/rRNA uracil-C5-methylase (TrmA/RlmC/RlmD family)
MGRDEKIQNILNKIGRKTENLGTRIAKQKKSAERLRIIMQQVGRENLLMREERKHDMLMREIRDATRMLKEYTNVLKRFFKNSKRYTDQEINGLHRGSLENIVNYVKLYS